MLAFLHCSTSSLIFLKMPVLVVTVSKRINEVWTKELWELFTKPISRRSDFGWRKETQKEICIEQKHQKMRCLSNWHSMKVVALESIELRKIKTKYCFVFMHNKALCGNSSLRDKQLLFLLQSLTICTYRSRQQWCNIFRKSSHKGRPKKGKSALSRALLSNCAFLKALFKQQF